MARRVFNFEYALVVLLLSCASFLEVTCEEQSSPIPAGFETDPDHGLRDLILSYIASSDPEFCHDCARAHSTSTPVPVTKTQTTEVPVTESPSKQLESLLDKLCQKIKDGLKQLEKEHSEFEDTRKLPDMVDKFSKEYSPKHSQEPEVIETMGLVTYVLQKLRQEIANHMKAYPKLATSTSTARPPIVTTEAQEFVEIIETEPEGEAILVGSRRGIPGEHFPDYTEVPITSFTCADKKYIPGFYADLETGCQVFHVCYEHRMESFLCPLGTIFNQPILACDYWYSSNCSLASHHYDVNAEPEPEEKPKPEVVDTIGDMITTVVEGGKPEKVPDVKVKIEQKIKSLDISTILKFLPVKAKVTVFEEPKPVEPTPTLHETEAEVVASKVVDAILTKTTKGISKTRDAIATLPEPVETPLVKPILKPIPIAKGIPVLKPKFIIPAAKVAKKIAVPAAKAKIVAAAVPIVKAKLAAAGVAVPLAKAKLATVPVAKAAVKLPMVKAGAAGLKMGVPVVMKAKMAISPLTKKGLALGYMKLLKAKKLALMG